MLDIQVKLAAAVKYLYPEGNLHFVFLTFL